MQVSSRRRRSRERRAVAVAGVLLASCGSNESTPNAPPDAAHPDAPRADASTSTVRIVTQSKVSYQHYTTIQSAVDAAKPGEWILIDVGTYDEAVNITTPNLHVRGMDRNKVVIDGKHQVGDGLVVYKTDNVALENLTVRDFDRASRDAEHGNQIWWNGGDGSGMIGLHGWSGCYLTTFSTGLLGGYGIFISNSENGMLEQVYASGMNDSGLYVGACRDCNATITHALVENCALGYSGTNSGGHLVVEDSVFQHNSNGVGPNSLNNDDTPPPQDGACNSGQNTSDTPTFASTDIQHCTIFRNNVVSHNDNFTTPANSTTASIPWGNGFILIGTYADEIDGNTIVGNPSSGLFGFENPDPFPPTSSTIYFQLSGNKITNNKFSGNATNTDSNAADIILAGGGFGSKKSVNNCASGNTVKTTNPPNLEGAWGCDKKTTPNPGIGALSYLLSLQSASQARKQVAQPVPPDQPTMPKPCDGVPGNPLCGT